MNRILGLSLCVLVLLSGCTSKQRSLEQVRERTADATATLKRDAKAVAEGVHEGWTRDNPVDINNASREQLQTLPGVSPQTAESIIKNRPYATPSELVQKRVVSNAEYDKIADRLKVKH